MDFVRTLQSAHLRGFLVNGQSPCSARTAFQVAAPMTCLVEVRGSGCGCVVRAEDE